MSFATVSIDPSNRRHGKILLRQRKIFSRVRPVGRLAGDARAHAEQEFAAGHIKDRQIRAAKPAVRDRVLGCFQESDLWRRVSETVAKLKNAVSELVEARRAGRG